MNIVGHILASSIHEIVCLSCFRYGRFSVWHQMGDESSEERVTQVLIKGRGKQQGKHRTLIRKPLIVKKEPRKEVNLQKKGRG